MKTHLLPAGYEFQKVLDDYERLRSGKELLDRGALKALAERDDNNARYDLLEQFRDYVLPNYDDPRSVYPEIKDQLVAAVVATRQTKPRPRETPFGNFPGIAADRIVEIVCDILVHYRYVDIDITFDAICELYPGAAGAEERKHLLAAAQRLAQNDLDVWKQAGPYVQTVLVQKINRLDRGKWDAVRPVLTEVLGEALKTEVHGVSSTYKTVTLSRGSAVSSDALARMRGEAMNVLKELYRTASSDTDKRKTECALFEATRRPMNGTTSNELLKGILENSRAIADFFTSIALTESYEMLQTLEHKLLWMYRHNQGNTGAVEPDAAVLAARDALSASILKFRDTANANRRFVIYKTLVGYEFVFPLAWADPDFDLNEEAGYRKARIGELVADVNEQNAEDWLATLTRCAETESDDLATFPSLGEFLQKLSEAKPRIVLGFVDRLGERLTGFLGVILSGLAKSTERAALDAKIAEWLLQEKHLVEMAHYLQFAPEFDCALLERILRLGIKRRDDFVVVHVFSSFAKRYSEAPEGAVETILLPSMAYFTERRDARWINLVWFIPKEKSPLRALNAEQTDAALKSLVYLPRIETHAEWVLGRLAEKFPEKVFDFFNARLKYANSREGDERYEDVPFQFYCLHKSFANIADHAVDTVRQRFVSGDLMFQFRGGRLLADSFPDFAEPFGRKLLSYVRPGHREDIEFVVRVMASYHGQPFLNETCKAVVRALPADDPLLKEVEIILESTGVLSGEFGHVHAYAAKKQEVADWITDPDANVRSFAERYVRLLDRQIAAEQRRGEESLEMRKRMYGEPDDDGDDGDSDDDA